MKVWIGLAQVVPKPGNEELLEGAKGAFVPTVGLAEDETVFASDVAAILEAVGFEVVQIEDIEPLQIRQQHYNVAPEILELANGLTPESPVAVSSTFDAYEAE